MARVTDGLHSSGCHQQVQSSSSDDVSHVRQFPVLHRFRDLYYEKKLENQFYHTAVLENDARKKRVIAYRISNDSLSSNVQSYFICWKLFKMNFLVSLPLR